MSSVSISEVSFLHLIHAEKNPSEVIKKQKGKRIPCETPNKTIVLTSFLEYIKRISYILF